MKPWSAEVMLKEKTETTSCYMVKMEDDYEIKLHVVYKDGIFHQVVLEIMGEALFLKPKQFKAFVQLMRAARRQVCPFE